MRRFLVISLFILLHLPAFSQAEKGDIFIFINEYEWSLDKHQDSFATSDEYVVKGLQLGGYPCHATIKKDQISKLVKGMLIEFDDNNILQKEEPSLFIKKMDEQLVFHLGTPDSRKDDINEFFSSVERSWYKENYRLDILAMYNSDNRGPYLITVRGFDKSEPNFRQSFWGDKKATVIQGEGKSDQSSSFDRYTIEDYIAGMPCDVYFSFTDNLLTLGAYSFTQKHTNRNDYINDYNKLVSLLTKKYGEPSENKPLWRNSLYKGNYEEYGFAISMGHLVYKAKWHTPLTDIELSLSGENSEIDLFLIYTSAKYASQRQSAEENKELIGL